MLGLFALISVDSGSTRAMLGSLGLSWGGPGANLEPSCSCLGPPWDHHGPSWGDRGPCWGCLGPAWGCLGPPWGHRGPSWGHLRAIFIHIWLVCFITSIKPSCVVNIICRAHMPCAQYCSCIALVRGNSFALLSRGRSLFPGAFPLSYSTLGNPDSIQLYIKSSQRQVISHISWQDLIFPTLHFQPWRIRSRRRHLS